MQPKLLLADDSVTIQRVIELTFADEDVKVVAVGDGKQAIERVQTDRPDIVLADVGHAGTRRLRSRGVHQGDPALAHIPVLLLTGAFEPIDEARARAVGCDGVLVKPFEPQMVISRVRDLLAGKRDGSSGKAATPPGASGGRNHPEGSRRISIGSMRHWQARAPPAPMCRRRRRLTPLARGAHQEMDLSGWNPPSAAASNHTASAQPLATSPRLRCQRHQQPTRWRFLPSTSTRHSARSLPPSRASRSLRRQLRRASRDFGSAARCLARLSDRCHRRPRDRAHGRR